MAINSNIILQAQAPPLQGSGFSQAITELKEIQRLIGQISGRDLNVRVNISDNITGRGGAVAGAAASQTADAARDIAGGFSEAADSAAALGAVAASTFNTADQLRGSIGQLGKDVTEITRSFDEFSNKASKTVTETRTLEGSIATISKVTERINKDGETITTRTEKQVDLNERTLKILRAQRTASDAARRARAESIAARAEQLSSEGFIADPTVGKNFVTFRKEIDATRDAIVELNRNRDEENKFTKINQERLRAVTQAQEAQRRAAQAASQQQRLLAEGFQLTNQRTILTSQGTRQLVNEYQKITTSPIRQFFNQQEVAIARVNDVTGRLTEETIKGAAAGRLIGDSFLSAAGKVTLWVAATTAIFKSIQLFREAVNITTELEKNTILLARVGGQNFAPSVEGQVAAAQQLTQQLVDLAAFYGVSATEAQKAAAVFARGGLNVQETAQATEAAIIASRIAELDLAESAKLLQSTLAQFNLRASELLPTIDRLNALSNRFTTTTNDLLQSVSRAGSVFAEAGQSAEQLTSATAVLVQTTGRSGTQVGNALRTIVSRLQSADVSNKILQQTGVAFSNADGTAQSLTATLALLEQQFQQLNSIERNQLTITASGIRQRNILSAAISKVTDIATAEFQAFQDVGSASAELQLELRTLNAAFGRLSAAFTSLVQAAQGGGVLKTIVDVLTSLVNVVTNLRTPIAILLGLAASFAAAKVAIFAFGVAVTAIQGVLGILILSIFNTSIALQGLIAGLAAINPLVAAVTAVIFVLGAAYLSSANAAEDLAEAQARIASSTQDEIKRVREQSRARNQLIGVLRLQVEELERISQRRAQRGEDPSLLTPGSDEAENRRVGALLDRVERLGQVQNLTSTSTKTLSDAEGVLSQALQRRNIATREAIQRQEELRNGAQRDIETTRNQLRELEARRQELVKSRQEIERLIAAQQADPGFLDRLNFLGAGELASLQRRLRDINDSIKDLDSADNLPKVRKTFEDLQQSIIDADNSIEQLRTNIGDFNTDAQRATLEALQGFANLKLRIEDVSEAFNLIGRQAEFLGVDAASAARAQAQELRNAERTAILFFNALQRIGRADDAKKVAEEINELRKRIRALSTESSSIVGNLFFNQFKKQQEDLFNSIERVTKAQLKAQLAINREPQQLFDFAESNREINQLERSINNLLVRVQGIGPQVQQNIQNAQINRQAADVFAQNNLIQQAQNAQALAESQEQVATALQARQAALRAAAAENLNRLADAQQNLVLGVLELEREITVEKIKQTQEAIKQAGLLGDEDKLRLFAQAEFFSRNPNVQISAERQLLAGAETNRIGQQFFEGRLAQEFDPNDPFGQAFVRAGFGIKRDTQRIADRLPALRGLVEAQLGFGVGAGVTEEQILGALQTRVNDLRRQALELQEEEFRRQIADFRNRGQLINPQQNLGQGGLIGGVNNAANFAVRIQPVVNFDPLIQAVNATVDKLFLDFRNRVLEFLNQQRVRIEPQPPQQLPVPLQVRP